MVKLAAFNVHVSSGAAVTEKPLKDGRAKESRELSLEQLRGPETSLASYT